MAAMCGTHARRRRSRRAGAGLALRRMAGRTRPHAAGAPERTEDRVAEIRVEPERRRGPGGLIWLWIVLAVLVLAGLGWWLYDNGYINVGGL
jgi:hypothetical protein